MPLAAPARPGTARLRRLLGGVVILGLLVAACSGDDDAEDASASTTATDSGPDVSSDVTSGDDGATSSTTVPTFTGDPDSPFCELVTEGQQRPVQDPFAQGLEPKEVELRLRNLRNRMGEFLAASPPELAGDLTTLVEALNEVDAALEPYDYDLGEFGADGGTLDILNSPEMEPVGFRLDQYNQQVCAAR